MTNVSLDLLDIVDSRLKQIKGTLIALGNSWSDEEDCYRTPDEYIRSALWGVRTLLDQAIEAQEKMLEPIDRLNAVAPDRQKPVLHVVTSLHPATGEQ